MTSRFTVTVNVLPGHIVPVMVRSAARVPADAGLIVTKTKSITDSTNTPVNIFFIVYSSNKEK